MFCFGVTYDNDSGIIVASGLPQTISLYQLENIPDHNASAKIVISTLFIFDLLIMHASRELARRLLLKCIKNNAFYAGKPTFSDSTPACNQVEKYQSVKSAYFLVRLLWSGIFSWLAMLLLFSFGFISLCRLLYNLLLY